MENRSEEKKCPVCGSNRLNGEHSRMGTCESMEGTVEYWACFLARDVFSVKPAEAEN